jgi:hypothetical protein
MRTVIALLALLSTAAIAESDFELRFPPNPPRYLRQIPLGQITERQLLDQLGIPQARMEVDGQDRWQYERIDQQNGLRLTWSYVLVDGVVFDVIHNATGCVFGKCPYNGMSARAQQNR